MSKHGQIAEGMARLSALIPENDKEILRIAAKKANRSLSNFIRDELEKIAKQKRLEAAATDSGMAESSLQAALDGPSAVDAKVHARKHAAKHARA